MSKCQNTEEKMNKKSDVSSAMSKKDVVNDINLQSKELYKSLFDGNYSVMLLIDPESGDIIDANNSASLYYGWSHDELCKMKITDINALTKEEVAEEMRKAVIHDRNLFYFRHKLADGQIRNVEVYSGPIKFGDTDLLYSIVHDITDRLKEEELKLNEQRLKLALQCASDGFWDWDVQANKVFYSTRWKAMLGFEEDEISHSFDEWRTRVHSDDINSALNKLIMHLNGQTDYYECQIRIRDKKGNYRWIQDEAKIVERDPDGKPLRVIGTSKDISERKKVELKLAQAKEQLEKRENQFASIIQSQVEGVAVVNKFHVFEFANNAAIEIFNTTGDELIGKSFNEFLSPEQAQILDTHILNPDLMSDGYYDFEIISKNHKVKRLSVSITAKLDNDNKFSGVYCVFRDVTKQRQSDEALRKSEEKYRFMFENNPQPMWILDLETLHFLEVNNAAISHYGYSRDEFLTMLLKDICPDEAVESFLEDIKAAKATNSEDNWINKWILKKKNGELIDVEVTSRLMSYQGETTGYVLYNHVAELKQDECEIRDNVGLFANLIISLGEGVLLENLNREILLSNQLFCDMFRISVSPENMIGTDCSDSAEKSKYLFKNPDKFVTDIQKLLSDKNLVLNDELELVDGRFFERDYIPTYLNNQYNGHLWKYRDITLRKRTEQALQVQLNLQKLLADISAEYINLPIDQINKSLQLSLGEMAKFVLADRAYIFEYDFVANTCSNTHEWCDPNITPQINELQHIPLEEIHDWIEIHRKELPLYIPDVFSLPQGALREILVHQKIKSLMTHPLISNNDCVGFIGFDWVKRQHEFSEIELSLLKVLSQIIVNVWQRKKADEKLRESEANYRRFFETIGDLIFVTNIRGQILFTNEHVNHKLEYSPEELYLKDIFELYQTEDRKIAKKLLELKLKGQLESSSLSIRTKKGRLLPVESRVWVDKWNGEECIFNIYKDLTIEKEANQRFEALFRDNPSMISLSRLDDFTFIDVNHAFIKKTGYSMNEILDQTPLKLGLLSDPKAYIQLENRILTRKKVTSIEMPITCKNGLIIDTLFSCEIIYSGGNEYLLTVMIDITDRKKTENALKASQAQLKKFATHLQNVREEERKLLSREIHDDMGQKLVALKIDIGLVKQKVLKELCEKYTGQIQSKFESLFKLIDDTINTARKIMSDLRPDILDLLGLTGALQSYVYEFEDRFKIKCQFTSNVEELNLNSEQSLALFRIVQEALNNVSKHSKATHAIVSLSQYAERLKLEITDNGIGFDQNKKKNIESYGLIGMKERVFLLDGEIEISSKPGNGTVIRVEMPNKKL